MSQSISLSDYRKALSAPGAAGPVITSLLARLPIAMIGLALMLYVQRETGSFAAAGLVSASVLIGVACGSVVQGRVMDRLGPSKPLYLMAGVFAVLVAAEVLAIETHSPVSVMTTAGFLVGLSEPQVGPASRSIWSVLLPPGTTRSAAYSYEAISMEVFFILGPGLAGVLVAMPWPGTGLAVGAACMVVGSIGFASTRAARNYRPAPPATGGGGSMLGALSTPGMRTLAVAALAFGVLVGFIEVGVPAAAVNAGQPTMGGMLLGIMSISSVAVGVVYGVHPWPRPLHLRVPVLVLLFGLLIALLAVPTTLWGLTLALLLVGSLITPQSTTHSVAIETAAPAGTATEAFGWVVTAVTLGSAVGQSVSGQLVELSGPPLAFLAAGGAGLLFTVVLWLRRSTLRSSQRPEQPDVPVAA